MVDRCGRTVETINGIQLKIGEPAEIKLEVLSKINGNAPINVFVSFSKKGNQKPIQFTIANPYILDEQYSGAVPTPETTASPAGTQAKATPFLSVIFMVGALLLAHCWGREKL